MDAIKQLFGRLFGRRSDRYKDDEDRDRRPLAAWIFFFGVGLFACLFFLLTQLPTEDNNAGPDFFEASGSDEEPTPTDTPTFTPTPTDTPTPTATFTPSPTPTNTDEPYIPICGDGICDPAVENSDLCSDCTCVDDGVCSPGEGEGCLDCGETAGTCNAACTDNSQCAEGYTCAGGICWSNVCAAEPVEPEIPSDDDDEPQYPNGVPLPIPG